MGIKGLHKGLAFCTKKGNLRDYRGRSIAVDSSSWLHRSVYSVSAKYVESMERKHLDSDCVRVSSQYIISRCYEILNSFHIAEIFLVMDGKRCPLKANESADREERRQQNLREARAFKQGGLRHKAEEKYKMCIKIRDELTLAVMDVVAKRFRNDKRVKVIWSPYEADAQLAKLCQDQIAHAVVTEDSDVLVYAAAVRVPFPVLFKLDRRNGCCDVISMDWLLSAPTSPANGKPKTALEGLLLNFASREARRSGFGVRLFVQGCVLAGCDYAPNTLPGVGLVNAFKLVRDSSFRNDDVRFQKILDSLPRKVKKTLDIKDYELTLAKSEAVFYYHMVLHLNGHCRPMTEPRVSTGEHGDAHHVTDHSPFMSRFGDNWTFLGESGTTGINQADTEQQHRQVQNQPVGKMAATIESKSTQSYLKATTTTTNKPKKQLFGKLKDNPYTKKRSAQSAMHTDANKRNPFGQFARKSDGKAPSQPGGILKFMQKKEDVRFVKRQFPSASASGSQTMVPPKARNSSGMFARARQRFERGPKIDHTHVPDSPIASFDYGSVQEECDAAATLEPTTATHEVIKNDSDECHEEEHEQEAEERPSINGHMKDDPLLLRAESNSQPNVPEFYDLTGDDSCDAGFQNYEHRDDMSDLGESDFSPADSVAPATASSIRMPNNEEESPPLFESVQKTRAFEDDTKEIATTRSKYFSKPRPRRITLDPSDVGASDSGVPQPQTKETPPEKQSRRAPTFNTPSPRVSSSDSFCEDEILESPLECNPPKRQKYAIPGTRYSSIPAIPKPRSAGPLAAAFNRQKRLSSSQTYSQGSKKRRVLGLSRKPSQDPSDLQKSFFKPRTGVRPALTQLETNRDQTKPNQLAGDDIWSD